MSNALFPSLVPLEVNDKEFPLRTTFQRIAKVVTDSTNILNSKTYQALLSKGLGSKVTDRYPNPGSDSVYKPVTSSVTIMTPTTIF
jgi:hypothetical protein